MNEHEFLIKLQDRAKEQEKIIKDMPFPEFFATVSTWLGKHPWRFLIPLAFVISLLFRSAFGTAYTDFVLWIFSAWGL